MTLSKPDFNLDKPNPNPDGIPDPIWWFMLRVEEMEPSSQNSGIFGYKPGFHASGKWNKIHFPNNYSIRDKVNQSGVGWEKGSAWDWTFPDAQRGNYETINKYSKRLWNSMHDSADPRLDLWMWEFFGQIDSDRQVEGYNEYREDNVTSNTSHLWHIHGSVKRSQAGSFWGAWATLTVLMGWSVRKWRDSLPATDPNSSSYKPPTPPKPVPPKPTAPGKLPRYELGKRQLKAGVSPGTDVAYVQAFCGGPDHFGKIDGIAGPKFTAGVKRYQRVVGLRGKDIDGIVGKKTWAKMGVK